MAETDVWPLQKHRPIGVDLVTAMMEILKDHNREVGELLDEMAEDEDIAFLQMVVALRDGFECVIDERLGLS